MGQFDEPVVDMAGPGMNIATIDHYYRPGGGLGGTLHDDVIKWPILFWYWAQAPDAPRWGRAALESMRDSYRRTTHVFGPVQETPHADARVTLADGVHDRWGNPVASLHGALHPETLVSARFLQDRGAEWLEAAGVERLWRAPIMNVLTAGQHQAGTCRMGDDPATSVTDRWGRVHGHRNLWVMDASLHVNNGGFNPVLTILALAYRSAEHLSRQ
jgi:choline dehydrogenase-like flavoprotein